MSPPGTLVDNVDIHGDETVAVYNSVQCPVMTCVHIAETGGECRWSGSEYWRAETLTVGYDFVTNPAGYSKIL